ncbi:MAG: putative metal-dependent hydrolase YcfH [Chlamydiae bacterium]|nr:putative metal-dependent hydrolase YcfH [Chlamydiota bacterium]
MYFDSHAHLTGNTLFAEIDSYLKRAQAASVSSIVNICTDYETLKRGLEIAKKYPWFYNTGATTPHDVAKEGEAFFTHFEKAAKGGSLVAIGETGLDYYYEHSPKELQKTFLKRYLQLALDCHLPVVIHCRDAFEDFFTILDSDYSPDAQGILHCFTGSKEEAKELVDRGWTLSFSGIVTFKKSEGLREAAEIVPLDQLLIETDSPYLAPQSQRGKTNEPAFVVEVAQTLAQVKGVELKQIAEATTKNASRIFKIAT